MNGYRSYMNRITVSPGLHRRLMDRLEAEHRTTRRRGPAALGWAGLAACCALAALAGWGALHGGGAPVPGQSGAALPPAAVETPAPAPARTEHTLLVEDPFGGEPHGNFSLPALDFTDRTGAMQLAASIAFPRGYFFEKMTAEDLIRALGGTDAVPWALSWAGFALDGTVVYDGEGRVWQAVITGTRGETSLTLRLAPGALPPEDTVYEGEERIHYNGVEVNGYYLRDDRDGDGVEEYVYHADFMSWDTGVRFQCASPDQETARTLTTLLVRQGAALAGGGFTTERLAPEAIPEWRSEALTLEQARAEALGAYLPRAVPAGFAFERAWRELGQDRDWLSASWYHGYDYIEVTVERRGEPGEREQWPDVYAQELTLQWLSDWGQYVDDDAGDTPGWRYLPFSVYWGDGVVAEYSIKGVSPEEAAALLGAAQ